MRISSPAVMTALMASLLAGGQAFARQSCEIGGIAVDPADRTTLQGRTGVMRCRDSVGGPIQREQDTLNGRFTGAMRYFSNGRLSREQMLNDRGKLQGRSREYAPGGQLLREGTYDNGALVGLARSFHLDGRLQRASFYDAEGEAAYAEFTRRGELRSLHCGDRPMLAPAVDDARLCGFSGKPSQVSFVAETGTLRARATFAGGRRTRYETFQDNGLPATQEELAPGGRIERIFGADGVRRREVLWSQADGQAGQGPSPGLGQTTSQGQREREQEFSSAGTLTRERRWSQGQLASEQTFYLNGQPRSKARYTVVDGVRTLETQDFYDSGVMSAEGAYIDTGRYAPIPVGLHRQFDLQGRLKTETLYDMRGRLLRERSVNSAGGPSREDEVMEDGVRRPPAR